MRSHFPCGQMLLNKILYQLLRNRRDYYLQLIYINMFPSQTQLIVLAYFSVTTYFGLVRPSSSARLSCKNCYNVMLKLHIVREGVVDCKLKYI
jgi:hypothetical protein